MPVDKNEAPAGYEAVAWLYNSDCKKCAFAVSGSCRVDPDSGIDCGKSRLDGQTVYFIKKTNSKYVLIVNNNPLLVGSREEIERYIKGFCDLEEVSVFKLGEEIPIEETRSVKLMG